MDPQTTIAAVSGASHAVVHTGFALFLDQVYYFIMVPFVYISIIAMFVGIIWKILSLLSAPAPAFTLRTFPARKRPVLAALGDTFGMPMIRKR
ncbi:MAG TPA: hypothetical protein DIT55_07830, partial [Spirochaetaceae bacterium]|nr:hypothetical protein [Spirochaetaceae bacterium]